MIYFLANEFNITAFAIIFNFIYVNYFLLPIQSFKIYRFLLVPPTIFSSFLLSFSSTIYMIKIYFEYFFELHKFSKFFSIELLLSLKIYKVKIIFHQFTNQFFCDILNLEFYLLKSTTLMTLQFDKTDESSLDRFVFSISI